LTETSKAKSRRQREGFFEKYCVGRGLDIGHGGDKVLPDAEGWEINSGDARIMAGVPDGIFDFVYSSHCLEHLTDPAEGIRNWWRILKPGGYLIVVVPDEDLYEQGVFPSQWNSDHKFSFTISKEFSWSQHCVNLTDLVLELEGHKVIYMKTIDDGYDYSLMGGGVDQSLGEAEVGIEMVVQKLA
jgi:SAM-dependent methyltransferase